MDSVAWRIGVRGGPSQPLRRCGGGVGSDVSDCLLALASGVTPSLDTISFMACGLVSVDFSKLISWPGCLARGGSCLAGEAR